MPNTPVCGPENKMKPEINFCVLHQCYYFFTITRKKMDKGFFFFKSPNGLRDKWSLPFVGVGRIGHHDTVNSFYGINKVGTLIRILIIHKIPIQQFFIYAYMLHYFCDRPLAAIRLEMYLLLS